MKTNFKLDTVEYLIDNLITSIELHQSYEEELKKTEHHLTLLGYNRQKVKLIHESLVRIKNLISLEDDNSEKEYEFKIKNDQVHLVKKND